MDWKEAGELLKVYFEPLRRDLTAKVRERGFGWTPCEHYRECIGWCPRCLELQGAMERLAEQYGELL